MAEYQLLRHSLSSSLFVFASSSRLHHRSGFQCRHRSDVLLRALWIYTTKIYIPKRENKNAKNNHNTLKRNTATIFVLLFLVLKILILLFPVHAACGAGKAKPWKNWSAGKAACGAGKRNLRKTGALERPPVGLES